MRRLTLAVAMLAIATLLPCLHAAEGDDDAAALIKQHVLALEDRDAGELAVAALLELGDARVKLAFERIMDNKVEKLNGEPIFLPGIRTGSGETERTQVYDLFAEVDADGNPIGEPLATVSPKDVESYRAHPLVRRKHVKTALSLLGLFLQDPVERLAATKDVGNKLVTDALPRLRVLAAEDAVAKIRHIAAESAALITLGGADPEADVDARAAAAVKLGELNSIRALDALRNALEDKELAAHQATIQAAIDSIESHATITEWIKHAFSGLSLGSILILVALGLAITFGLMGVINMAHGEMMMIGAVTSWACFEFIGGALPEAWFNWYYVIAFPLAFLTAGLVGVATEWLIVRHLYKRPLDSMLATIGLSFVLIQAVRLWKGDNLGMTTPSWFAGGWEIIQDVVLPYNRLFIIVLTLAVTSGIFILFKYTRFGLMLRATVQNREIAASLGVNTRLVDLLTFGLGAGIAGIAGFGIVLITNVTPEMGQTYIVKSFLVTVVGGVGKLIGVVVSGLGLGFLEKFIEPLQIIKEPLRIFDAAWAQIAVLVLVVFFMQRRPSGLFPDKGRAANQADISGMPWLTPISRKMDFIYGGSLCFLALIVVPILYGTGAMSPEFVNKLGYIFAFAVCAIGLDLLWGYMGVMSLCQFLFFALGGYGMGLYLINHGPTDTNGIPTCLAYVMSDVSDPTPPWFLPLFDTFFGAVTLAMLVPGALALIIGLTTFRSRVRGVYFAILTQAVCVGAKLLFEKNDLKLGGTNGLTNFDTILGFHIASDAGAGAFEQTRFWLYIVSFLSLAAVFTISKLIVNSGFGRLLIAIRDDETRLRFSGYQPWAWKTLVFTLAAMFAAIGGMLYVPQKGIITPHQIAPFWSIMVVAWVAFGGRGNLWGAVFGTIIISLAYDMMTSYAADYWMFVLGAVFIAVPLGLPGGVMSIPMMVGKLIKPQPKLTPATQGGAP